MSSPEQIRRQIDDVVKKRATEDKHAADAQRKAADKNATSTSFRDKANRASSPSMTRSYERQADSARNDAITYEKKAADHAGRSADCTGKEADLSRALSSALAKERSDQQRARKRQETEDERSRKRLQDAERQARTREQQIERARTEALVFASESRMSNLITRVREPQVEQLRILYATASSDGGLRVDQEIRRVQRAVKAATHRDLVQIKPLVAATPGDLLDEMSAFAPHVVHFSGHANEQVLVFDQDVTRANPGQRVRSGLFVRALMTDAPPTLVVLNACHSAHFLDAVLSVVPVAIGMSDEIHDPDAMSFAARLYTSIADGQSVLSAYNAARLQMELDGLPDADLPVLRAQPAVDPGEVVLVVPPL